MITRKDFIVEGQSKLKTSKEMMEEEGIKEEERLISATITHAENMIDAAKEGNGKLDYDELFQMGGHLTHTAALQNNRCAIVIGFATIMNNLGVSHSKCREFIYSQMDKEKDCREKMGCTRCFDGKPKEDADMNFIYMDEGSQSIN